jgi:MFS family permease
LYVGYGFLGGTGIGLAYTPPVATLMEWFPEKKGVASGLTIAGFGSAALLFTPSMQYLMIRIRTVFMRVAAIMYAMMNIMSTGISSGKSVMNGPVGQTISFLCFAPETPVELASGQFKEMGTLDIGDVLVGGHTVTSLYAFAASNEPLYYYDGVLVTGSHRLADGTRIDQSIGGALTNETRSVLVCLDTDTGFVKLNTTLFRDFEFDSPENPYKISSWEGTDNIAGLRRRSNQWEVLVRGT